MPGGSWNSSGASAAVVTGTVTGVSTGTAVISYTISNSCLTSTVTHTVVTKVCPSGLQEQALPAVTIWPNPARQSISISVPGITDQDVVIIITNVTGQVVARYAGIVNGCFTVPLLVPAGIYSVTATTATSVHVVKLVVE